MKLPYLKEEIEVSLKFWRCNLRIRDLIPIPLILPHLPSILLSQRLEGK
jgi:hypothetical protein